MRSSTIPPRSFVSSVYCASPSPSRVEVVREHAPGGSRKRTVALDVELAHVRDVEDAARAPHGEVLRDDALVLHGHLPAGERHDAAPRAQHAARGAASSEARRSPDPRRRLYRGAAGGHSSRRKLGISISTSASAIGGACSRDASDCAPGVGVVAVVLLRPRRCLAAEAGRDHGHADLVLERLVDDRAEDHVGVPVGVARNDLGRLVDLEEPDVGRTGDVEEDARRAVERRLEKRGGHGARRRLGGAALAARLADAHQGRAGVRA